MSPALDEDLVQRVSDLGTSRWSGTTYRHVATRRDPLSGAGAKLFGGRWNPPDAFNAIYLAEPAATCMAELDRLAASQNLSVQDLLNAGRTLHTIAVRDLSVLDLRTAAACARVGLEPDDLADDDWTACQAIGHAAHFLNIGGVLAPSATGTGLVLTAFEARLRPGQLVIDLSQPLTAELYGQLYSHEA